MAPASTRARLLRWLGSTLLIGGLVLFWGSRHRDAFVVITSRSGGQYWVSASAGRIEFFHCKAGKDWRPGMDVQMNDRWKESIAWWFEADRQPDTLLVCAPLWIPLALLIPLTLWGWVTLLRRRAGDCAYCAYPMAAAERCPECGKAARRRRSRVPASAGA